MNAVLTISNVSSLVDAGKISLALAIVSRSRLSRTSYATAV
jgi:hypothetical protein